MRIGALAEAAGVSRDTLRYYEKQKLIRADRWPNGYRDYPEGMVEMVRMIRQGQALGFSLKEIGALVKGLGGGLSQAEVEKLLAGKLADIDARMKELAELRAVVAQRLAEACPLGLDAPGSLDPKRVAS
ncbi:MerR family transcriptional regulator [Shimia sagamensis]|uniref:MerR family transcriptional regulator, copper efflux regulator n=1 Tax=Shimia sagamensis TaxID=1566352 RepID=A0ABY1NYP1_9RHOB|nr:MerR family transcriptional regulator [Shimia sagamensis]SMP21747.1 MerR family transcriptional regulator, copper efflux regulator [Shimia sagamensis]